MATGGSSPSVSLYVFPHILRQRKLQRLHFPCRHAQLTIANNAGVTVKVQQDGSGAAQPVFPGTYYVSTA